MSSSVTVIKGVVWTKRSITWCCSGATTVGTPPSETPGDRDHKRGRGRERRERERLAQPKESWDSRYSGRNFERRIKTV